MNKRIRNKTIAVGILAACLLGGCGDNAQAEVPGGKKPGIGSENTYHEEYNGDNGIETGNTDIVINQIEQIVETEANDDIVTITISAAGDVTLGNYKGQEYTNSFDQTYVRESNEYFFKNVLDIFAADDMTIVNFEGVLTLSEEVQVKDYNMKGPPEYVGILTEGSIEAVSFGNNHRLDYLAGGSRDTVDIFEENGIAYAYDNIVGVYEVKGIRIGFVSVNEASQHKAVEKYLQEGINKLKTEEEVDLIIACCHWGIEREHYPEDYQEELGRKCIDWGADLVLGSHPHVLQGVDVYEGKFIVYSLGNFCFGANRNPADKDTMIFSQTFTFIDGQKQEDMVAQVIPCSVSSLPNRNDYCPTPAKDEEYIRILQRINEYSTLFGVRFDEDGFYDYE